MFKCITILHVLFVFTYVSCVPGYEKIEDLRTSIINTSVYKDSVNPDIRDIRSIQYEDENYYKKQSPSDNGLNHTKYYDDALDDHEIQNSFRAEYIDRPPTPSSGENRRSIDDYSRQHDYYRTPPDNTYDHRLHSPPPYESRPPRRPEHHPPPRRDYHPPPPYDQWRPPPPSSYSRSPPPPHDYHPPPPDHKPPPQDHHPPPQDHYPPPQNHHPPPQDHLPPPQDRRPPPQERRRPPPQDHYPPPRYHYAPPPDHYPPPPDDYPPPQDRHPPPQDRRPSRWDEDIYHYDERQTRESPNYDRPYEMPPAPPPYRRSPPERPPPDRPPPDRPPPDRPPPDRPPPDRPPPERRSHLESGPPPREGPPIYERRPPPPPPDRDTSQRFSDRPPQSQDYDDREPLLFENQSSKPAQSRRSSLSQSNSEKYMNEPKSELHKPKRIVQFADKFGDDEQNDQKVTINTSDTNAKAEESNDESDNVQSMLDVRFADESNDDDVTSTSKTNTKPETTSRNNENTTKSLLPFYPYLPNFFPVVPVTPEN